MRSKILAGSRLAGASMVLAAVPLADALILSALLLLAGILAGRAAAAPWLAWASAVRAPPLLHVHGA